MTTKNTTPKFGQLTPHYRFILNTYKDLRCSTCPECRKITRVRKVPLVVAVQPDQIVVINKHCRYCPDCEILIAHQDELENMLSLSFEQRFPEIIGNDYLVIGTLEPSVWRKRGRHGVLVATLPDTVHDFKGYLDLEYIPPHWGLQMKPTPKCQNAKPIAGAK